MKKVLKSAFALLGGVAMLASCAKENVQAPTPEINMTITASQDDATKTVLGEGGVVTWNATGEKLAVLQNNGTKFAKSASKEGVTEDGGATMKFGVSFTSETAESFTYYAIYPNEALQETPTMATETRIVINDTQKPTANSFGPNSDVLIAKPLVASVQPTEFSLQFARIVAVGKMEIANLSSTEKVKNITITAPGKELTGRCAVNLEDGSVTHYGMGVNNITLDYSTQTIAANGMTAYFTCWATDFAAGEKFTVTVETESKVFTKEVTVPEGRTLAFHEGKASPFTVDFAGITGEDSDTSVDLVAASLTFNEISDDSNWGAYTTTYDYTQSNGAVWQIRAYKNGYIQLNNATDTKNKGYVKLPDFKQPIRTVKITLSISTYAKTLGLCTTADATSSDIASITGTGNTAIFEYDLTGKDVHTAYVRSFDGACQGIASIEVTAGEDKRVALPAPETVMAELAVSDPDVTNSIYVAWSKVAGAASYQVIATPAAGDAKSVIVDGGDSEETIITGLVYETEYTISVVAKAAAGSTEFKDSEAGVAEEKVTTGTKPAGTVEPKTGTILFGTNNVKIDAASVTANDDLNNSWTITTVASQSSFTQQSTYSQIGASKKPATSITFTTTLPSSVKVTAFSAKFGGFSGTAGSITMKVGETTVGTGSLSTTNDVTVSSTSSAEGNVLTITVTDIAKGVKAYNITYTYE